MAATDMYSVKEVPAGTINSNSSSNNNVKQKRIYERKDILLIPLRNTQ